jgi:Type II intron maturase
MLAALRQSSTGKRGVRKRTRLVWGRAGGKGLQPQYLVCGLSYWLIGFIGSKEEAEAIKSEIKAYLHEELKLDLSEEKTVITHARTQSARFLNYEISTMQENTYRPKGKRYVNGKIELKVPSDVLKTYCGKYLDNGKARHRAELMVETDFTIMAQYQSIYRGIVQYYQGANNLHRFNHLKWIMGQSLVNTLAAKFKLSAKQTCKKYQATRVVDQRPYKVLQVTIAREGKKPLIASWGGIPLRRNIQAVLNDSPQAIWTGKRSELEKRLLADTCELCGSHDNITVHHIRALKDLHQKGRREKPRWMQVMAARQRKTLLVCWPCHRNIHAGRNPAPSTRSSKSVSLESHVQ